MITCRSLQDRRGLERVHFLQFLEESGFLIPSQVSKEKSPRS